MKAPSPPKLRHVLLEAIFRRRGVVFGVAAGVLLLVVLVTVLMPRRYRSEAKLSVANLRSAAPLATSAVDRQVAANDVSSAEIASEVDLLGSRAVALRALKGSHEIDGTQSARGIARAVDKLRRRLSVEAVRGANTIDLQMLGETPEEADRLLGRVLESYYEARAGSARSGGAASFFEAQARQASDVVDRDQSALTAYEVAHGFSDLDAGKKLQVERIAALEDQLAAADASLADQRGRVAAGNRQLSMTPHRTDTAARTLTNQYVQEQLTTVLVQLQNRRSELIRRYPPTDRQVTEVEEKIATTRQALADSQAHPASDTATDVNPVWQQLKATVEANRTEASGTDAQRAVLAAQVKAARVRLNDLEAATAGYDDLKRRLAQAQADYGAYAAKRDEARVAEALDREKIFDVATVQPPMASPDPVRPRPVLYLAAGLLAAILLGVLAAIYVDTSSGVLYAPAQLDEVTGRWTLGTLAEEGARADWEAANAVEFTRLATLLERFARERAVEGRSAPGGGTVAAISSAERGAGVSYVTAGIAAAAVRQTGLRVAVLDLSALQARFAETNDAGFALKLDAGRAYWVLAERPAAIPASIPAVTPAPGPAGSFAERLAPLLAAARRSFGLLLLDCPAWDASALAGELERSVDGFVTVVAAGATRRSTLEALLPALESRQPAQVGFLLNRRRYPVPRWLYRLAG